MIGSSRGAIVIQLRDVMVVGRPKLAVFCRFSDNFCLASNSRASGRFESAKGPRRLV